jgi:hypothetical protein
VNNYGEELAYWYFRLNGFFPLANFVLHRNPGRQYPGDADILAVRPPFADEEIGGVADADGWVRSYQGTWLGVVCQVKTGRYQGSDLFRENDLEYATRRLGFGPDFRASLPGHPDAAATIVRLLIAPDGEDTSEYRFLSLRQVNQFIVARMRQYDQKRTDRHFFPSNMLQYIISIDDLRDPEAPAADIQPRLLKVRDSNLK